MSYGDFASASPARTGTGTASPPPEPKFALLEARKHGFGKYHFNHFLHFFDAEVAGGEKEMAATLTAWMHRSFEPSFSLENIAAVLAGSGPHATFDGRPTMCFRIGGNAGKPVHHAIGALHPDWVAMSTYPAGGGSGPDKLDSFSGSTLRRMWMTEGEQLATRIYPDVRKLIQKVILDNPGLIPKTNKFLDLVVALLIQSATVLAKDPKSLEKLIEINKKHFLAGVRSWRIGFNEVNKRYFVETATVERYSDMTYELSDELPAIPKLFAHDIRQDIVDLWSMHMNNVVRLLRHTTHIDGFAFKEASTFNDYYFDQEALKLLDQKYKRRKFQTSSRPGICWYNTASLEQSQLTRLAEKDLGWILEVVKRHSALAGVLTQVLKK